VVEKVELIVAGFSWGYTKPTGAKHLQAILRTLRRIVDAEVAKAVCPEALLRIYFCSAPQLVCFDGRMVLKVAITALVPGCLIRVEALTIKREVLAVDIRNDSMSRLAMISKHAVNFCW
jgi:hypothetical protein